MGTTRERMSSWYLVVFISVPFAEETIFLCWLIALMIPERAARMSMDSQRIETAALDAAKS